MLRLLALSATAAALFSVSFRPWGNGYFALVAVFLLILALVTEKKPWRGALAAGIAWMGMGVPAVEGTAADVWWALPALVGLLSVGWLLSGGLYVWLRKRLSPAAAVIALPVLLTTTELITSQRWIFGDAAVGLLAYTQADTLLKSLAPWSGTSAVTMGLLLLGAGAYALYVRKWNLAAWLTVPVLAVALIPAPGTRTTNAEPNLTVGAVQGALGSLDQVLAAYDRNVSVQRASRYEQLIDQAVDRGAELVVLGETILPAGIDSSDLPPHLRSMLSRAPATIVGSREYAERQTFNSAFLWTGTGIEPVYRKRALVPIIEESYGRGTSSEPAMAQGALVGLAICLDTIHAGLIRESVVQGAEMLVFITDDTFAGFTATPSVHLRTAALRAAETARATVFTNEWGPSAVFDQHGKLIAGLDLGAAGVVVAELPLSQGTTPFVRFGDWLGRLAFIAVIGLLVFCLNRQTSGLNEAGPTH